MPNSPGIRYSLILHLAMVLLMVFGLPSIFKRELPPEPTVISVEILPVTGKTNIKPSSPKKAEAMEQAKPQPKAKEKEAEPQVAEKAAPATRTDSTPPPPKETVKPDAPKEEKKPEPKPKEEPKPKKKEEPKKEKPQEDDLSAILKSVANAAKREEKKAPPTPAPKEQEAAPNEANQSPPNTSKNYDNSMPLSMSENDALRSQIMKCWNMPSGAKDAHLLVPVIRAQFNTDGSLIHAELAQDQGRYNSDGFFRAAADAAMRAVKRCTPLQGMPIDRHAAWGDVEIEFNPALLY